jgi:hypothetical protein
VKQQVIKNKKQMPPRRSTILAEDAPRRAKKKDNLFSLDNLLKFGLGGAAVASGLYLGTKGLPTDFSNWGPLGAVAQLGSVAGASAQQALLAPAGQALANMHQQVDTNFSMRDYAIAQQQTQIEQLHEQQALMLQQMNNMQATTAALGDATAMRTEQLANAMGNTFLADSANNVQYPDQPLPPGQGEEYMDAGDMIQELPDDLDYGARAAIAWAEHPSDFSS